MFLGSKPESAKEEEEASSQSDHVSESVMLTKSKVVYPNENQQFLYVKIT